MKAAVANSPQAEQRSESILNVAGSEIKVGPCMPCTSGDARGGGTSQRKGCS